MDNKPSFFKKWGYLFSIGSILGAFFFLFAPVLKYETKYYNDSGDKIKEYFSVNFVELLNPSLTKIVPVITILVLIGIGFVLVLLAGLLSKKISKDVKDGLVVGSIFSMLLAVCFLFANKEIFSYFAVNGEPSIENFNEASIGWGSGACLGLLSLAIIFNISYSSYSDQNSVKAIAEDGILIASAFVLNFIKIPLTTGGGSINFQMLPLMIIALRRGPLHGFVCGGIIYGVLTCITDGYGFATYPFDYLIAFGSVGVLGFFRKLIVSESQTTYNLKGELFLLLGGVLATFVRFFGSTISSMVIYGLPLEGALLYNAVYIPVSGAISLAVIMAAYGPFLQINKRFPAERLESVK